MITRDLDSRVLDQLMHVQSAILKLPDLESIFSFIKKELKDIPGVNEVNFDIEISKEDLDENFYIVFPVKHNKHLHGELIIELNEKSLFIPYKENFKDFALMLGVILEERKHRFLGWRYKKVLEEKEKIKTKELKVQKNNILESQNYFYDLLSNVSLMSVILDTNGDIKYCNKFFLESSGFTYEEIINKNWFDIFIDKKIREDLFDVFKDLIIGGELFPNFENEIIVKNNRKLSVYWSNTIMYNENGKISGIASIGVDITENKKNEILLKESNEEYEAINEELKQTNEELCKAKETTEMNESKFRRLVENTSDFIWEIDAKGIFTYVSPGVKGLLGYEPEEILGKSAFDLMNKDEANKVNDVYQYCVSSNRPLRGMLNVNIHKDGREVILESNGEPILDTDGVLIGYRGVDRDVTERKMFEEQLLEAKEKAESANRLKMEFLNNMSHEIRTPMNGIIGFANLLGNKGLTEDKKEYYTKIIMNSSNQLLRIIDDILEISTLETKQEKINEEELCLNDFMMELFSIFNLKSKERNISFYLKKGLNDDESCIYTDRSKLNKILCNLIENALKFTQKGYVEFGYNLEEDDLVLYVKDTGIGILKDNQDRIFERFSQEDSSISRRHGGLGLGLSISKENVKLLGGRIEITSDKGKGSTFNIVLPYKPSRLKKAEVERLKDDKVYIILIAEDEEVNYLYLEALFDSDKEGVRFNIIHAKDGKEAIEYCMKNKDIDLVLMDIKMPSINGNIAAEEIKSKYPNLPIIAQTAYSRKEDMEKSKKYGCDDYLVKPIDRRTLFEVIDKYLFHN